MKRILLIGCLVCAMQMGTVSEVVASNLPATAQTSAKARKKTTARKATAPVKKIELAGTTYSGSGNGGGLGVDMTIRFKENGKCQLTSDFYRAYDNPVTVEGTYYVNKKGKVVVKCHPGEFDEPIDWTFSVKENGKELSYNNSDPQAYGSMGNDFLFLEKE